MKEECMNFKLLSISKLSDKLEMNLGDIERQKAIAFQQYKTIQNDWDKLKVMNKRIAMSKTLLTSSSKQLKAHQFRLKSNKMPTPGRSPLNPLDNFVQKKRSNLHEAQRDVEMSKKNIVSKKNQLRDIIRNIDTKKKNLTRKSRELVEIKKKLDMRYRGICEELVAVEDELFELGIE